MHFRCFVYCFTVIIGYTYVEIVNGQPHSHQALQGSSNFRLGNHPSYVIVASKVLRPNSVYALAVTLLKSAPPCSITASVSRDGTEIASAVKFYEPDDTESILLKIPPLTIEGSYFLRVEGNANNILGVAFNHSAELDVANRFLTIIIYTNRPVYNANTVVLIRALVFTMDMKPFSGAVNLNILDPSRYIMTGYPSLQLKIGVGIATYTLPEFSVTGAWRVQVDAWGQVEEKEFLVEKVFIPKFEVYVWNPEYILSHRGRISGKIMAMYDTYGQVRGNATVKLYADALGKPNGPEKSLFLFEEILDPFYGKYEFDYRLEELYYDVQFLVGKVVRIEVSVWDQLMDLHSRGYGSIYIMDSQLQLRFLGARNKVFKPGMPFRTHISISHNNAAPLSKERLSHSQLTVTSSFILSNGDRKMTEVLTDRFGPDGVLNIQVDTPANAQYLFLNAHYKDSESTANSELIASSYVSRSNRTIYVHVSSSPAEIGHYCILHVRANFYMESFNYAIISKGILLFSGKEEVELLFRPIKTISIPVSSEMTPSFRVLVYHVTFDGHVVSDSITIPVKSINPKKMEFRVTKNKDKSGSSVEFGFSSKGGGFAGFAAQDADTFCHKCGGDLTPTMILENLYSFDEDTSRLTTVKWIYPDVTPDKINYYDSSDWAEDDASTFTRAGVIVFTDGYVPQITDRCSQIPDSASCMNGACYPVNGTCDGTKQCSNGFDEINCYREMDWPALVDYRLYRKNRVSRFYDQKDGDWAWDVSNTDGIDYKSFQVPNRPSNWLIYAFRTDLKHGISLLEEPYFYEGIKPFFMNVAMPTFCKLGEQIGIRIDAFNNEDQGIFVTFVLLESDYYKFIHVEQHGLVRSYNPRLSRGEHQLQTWIQPKSVLTLHFPIAIQKIGKIDVTVEARTGVAVDSTTITIVVEPNGVSQFLHTSLLLDLKTQPLLIKYLNINVTESPIVPFTKWRLFLFDSPQVHVSVVGDVLGPLPQGTMPVTTDMLLRKPEQAAEPILFSLGANLWSIIYLRLTNQLTKPVLGQALLVFNYYYAYLMRYQNEDGSFSMWIGHETSVWLTAAVLRVYQQGRYQDWENDYWVDLSIIHSALTWLMDYQTEEGAFVEILDIPLNPRMYPKSPPFDSHPRHNNIPLTAFVLISFCEITNIQGELRGRVASTKARAMAYLEQRLVSITDPYEMAIVTYALTRCGSVDSEMAFLALDKMKKDQEGAVYWSTETYPLTEVYLDTQRLSIQAHRPCKADALSVEATSYALLVYIAREGVLQENIVRWLTSMRGTDGGFISSQDSLVAMQALTEYSFRERMRDITNLRVSVRASSGDVDETLIVNEGNLYNFQVLPVPKPWGYVEVVARGSGMAMLQMELSYSIDHPPYLIPPPEKAFDLAVKARYSGRNNSHIHVTACQRWTLIDVAPTSGVVAFEMDLPTGYYQHQPFLDEFVQSGQVPNLRNLYVTQKKIYAFFRLLDDSYTCFNFTLERWWPVANLSHYIKAKVYDYYNPELYNESIFEAYTLYLLDICQVCGSYQCPYCFDFNHSQAISINILLLVLCITCCLGNENFKLVWAVIKRFIIYPH